MKVQIISPDSWILYKIAKELDDRLDYTKLTSLSHPYKHERVKINDYDINYYINYNMFRYKSNKIDTALFTHTEENKTHYNNFISIAKKLDHCVSMSIKYENVLRSENILNCETISMGVDLNLYKPKLILGYIAKLHRHRKGGTLLEKMKKLDFIELRITNGKLEEDELPNFYRQLDYTIVPSKIEGGPMCLLESFACGIPVIAPKDVGMVEEFNKGLVHYENSDFESLKTVLEELYEKKLYISNQVKEKSWDHCAKNHDKLFKSLYNKKL